MDISLLQARAARDLDTPAKQCTRSFKHFVDVFWPLVPGAGEIIWNWHMEMFCYELQTVARRVFKAQPKEYDMVCNVSPGTSKSTIWSILFPAWVWTEFPQGRILTASHTDMLVVDLANKSRSVIRSSLYQRLFPHVQIRDDTDSKSYYANTLGGDRLTCTVGGKSPMGFHAHFIIVDDPIDPKKAVSEIELANARDFMTNVIPSRKVNKEVSVTLLIMQRLHREDPTQVMITTSQKEGAALVRWIRLPAETAVNEEGQSLPGEISPPEFAEFYKDGLMDPKRLSRKVLKEAFANLGPYGYAGQFLQRPIPPGGGMFKEKYFNQRVPAAPYNVKCRVRAIDRAATADGGCYTAMVLMALGEDDNWYVEHVKHGQWEPDERNDTILAVALRDRARYGPNQAPRLLVERETGSTGKEAFKGLARKLAGFPVYEIGVTGSKDVRAEPWATTCAAGNVYLVDDGTWDIPGYIEEHCLFKPDPERSKRLGKYKDRVDASSLAHNWIADRYRLNAAPNQMALRSFLVGGPRKSMRLVVMSYDHLAIEVIEHRCLIISFENPQNSLPHVNGFVDNNGVTVVGKVLKKPPLHGCRELLEHTELCFADLAPAEVQDKWEHPVAPWNDVPEKLIMNPGHGKELWKTILKKREPATEVIVFVDNGGEDRRALSTALAVADSLRLPRLSSVYIAGTGNGDENAAEIVPPNGHIYSTVKATKSTVIT